MASTIMIGTTSLLGIGVMTAVPAFADMNPITKGVCTGAGVGTGASDCTSSGFNLTTLATSAVNIFSWVVGIVAVIMIIVGGFRYITSGGDSNKVGGAKNTLIYAIVGLLIVALAQFIVHYVVQTATSGSLSNTQ